MSLYIPERGPTRTVWTVSPSTGNLLCVRHNDPSWTTIVRNDFDFPMSAGDVATLMNIAFQSGMAAKQEELRNTLGIER